LDDNRIVVIRIHCVVQYVTLTDSLCQVMSLIGSGIIV
jgi:hypothetical protein